jgi:glycosyltransferase involved in cell wall biosynthesis
MWALMARCDVLVNLRYPTMGETSGSVMRALSLGKALVVSDVGWFAELPDDVALKVPVDELEVAMLEAAIGFAADHADELGAAARAYVEREHALPNVADAYVAALEVAGGGDAVDDAVLRRIAEAAAEVGHTDPVSLARAAVDSGIVG